ncbi:hypothetical protein C8R46DRAFT_1009101 [Mycena filopes]|nr:hypothetical protein C8R46DRAFT_1009101 [Mycena filopes]
MSLTSPAVLSPEVWTPAVTRAHIEAMTARMNSVYHYLCQLNVRRNTLKAHLDAYIYPVLTLPNEIVSEIFLHTVPSDLGDRVPDPTHGPLLVAQICRKWRDIALSTPRLWSGIALELTDAGEAAQLDLLDTWIARSRDSPLSISIFHNKLPDPGVVIRLGTMIEPFIEAIALHSKRWKHLELFIPISDFMRVPFNDEMPLLQTLTLGITDMDMFTGILSAFPPSPSWPKEIFHAAPALREFRTVTGFAPKTLLPPWAQLTTIILLNPQAPNTVLEILRSASTVSTFTSTVGHYDEEDDEDARRLTAVPPLTHLAALRFICTRDARYIGVLQQLTLPALRTLTLSELPFFCGVQATVRALLERSRSPVEEMCITITDAVYKMGEYRDAWPGVGHIQVEGAPGYNPKDSESEQEAEEEEEESDGNEEANEGSEDSDDDGL